MIPIKYDRLILLLYYLITYIIGLPFHVLGVLELDWEYSIKSRFFFFFTIYLVERTVATPVTTLSCNKYGIIAMYYTNRTLGRYLGPGQ
jgi:hypothetical protein